MTGHKVRDSKMLCDHVGMPPSSPVGPHLFRPVGFENTFGSPSSLLFSQLAQIQLRLLIHLPIHNLSFSPIVAVVQSIRRKMKIYAEVQGGEFGSRTQNSRVRDGKSTSDVVTHVTAALSSVPSEAFIEHQREEPRWSGICEGSSVIHYLSNMPFTRLYLLYLHVACAQRSTRVCCERGSPTRCCREKVGLRAARPRVPCGGRPGGGLPWNREALTPCLLRLLEATIHLLHALRKKSDGARWTPVEAATLHSRDSPRVLRASFFVLHIHRLFVPGLD